MLFEVAGIEFIDENGGRPGGSPSQASAGQTIQVKPKNSAELSTGGNCGAIPP